MTTGDVGMDAHPPRPRSDRRTDERGRTLFALSLALLVLVAEVVGGLLTHSVALLADAAHVATDAAALGLVLSSLWLARRPPSQSRSYGFQRGEILAALANGLLLVAAAVWVLIEAARRFANPEVVHAGPMVVIAAMGLFANLLAALMLHSGAAHSLTMRGALLHVVSDALGSVGALLAGVLILTLQWYRADAVFGLLIGVLVLASATRLLLPAIHILLEGTPREVDLVGMREGILANAGVLAVHDIHAWTLTSGYNAMTAHVVIQDHTAPEQREALLDSLRHMLPARFPVRHVTIQLEESSHCCDEDHQPNSAARPSATAPHGHSHS